MEISNLIDMWYRYEGMGSIPIIGEDENRNLLAALIGTIMGGAKKASKELELRKKAIFAASKSVIRPRCFEDSLELVSRNRVYDLKEEYKEYLRFFDNLKDTIQRSPVEEDLLCKALEKSGVNNPKEEITNLISIGILRPYQRRLSDKIRYHFPDVYLKGLGLQRAGMR